ncbi:Gfo/Idh/MocA family protein [Paenibacillus cremeus]|uniref:Gfo/Idh/MocA family oxidoreductase n=1 Tax=Paenibacillus cremeus TaxID=2163881 RepID=A0A559JMC6_9BACL|nr:Gfo/Idh/MocA family oxidoreductase [Paenibacillus cremeus]TVY01018.1 Gfo/Idh/MocA family oxidoreductase [Paenibacillus cremeus]
MIRFGIIGTNSITEQLIKSAREAEGFVLTAVYSRSEETAAQFADKHDIPHRFTDLEQMAASSELDAVYIASPNSFHARQAITLMNHGKHVLCEKPIASNRREVQEMFAAAKRNNVLLMEAMKSTLLPNFQAIQANLHKIGRVRRYVASFCQYSSRYDAFKAGVHVNTFDPAFSNGSLMDIGVYCLYPMVVLFGKPDRLQAEAVMLESGVDGEGSLLLKYEGMDAVILHSKITQSHQSSEIQGEKGTIVFERVSQPAKVEIRYLDGTVEELSQPQKANTMYYEVQSFMDLIRSGQTESPVNSYANSLAVMELMDEARRQIGLVYPADRQ